MRESLGSLSLTPLFFYEQLDDVNTQAQSGMMHRHQIRFSTLFFIIRDILLICQQKVRVFMLCYRKETTSSRSNIMKSVVSSLYALHAVAVSSTLPILLKLSFS